MSLICSIYQFWRNQFFHNFIFLLKTFFFFWPSCLGQILVEFNYLGYFQQPRRWGFKKCQRCLRLSKKLPGYDKKTMVGFFSSPLNLVKRSKVQWFYGVAGIHFPFPHQYTVGTNTNTPCEIGLNIDLDKSYSGFQEFCRKCHLHHILYLQQICEIFLNGVTMNIKYYIWPCTKCWNYVYGRWLPEGQRSS